MAESRKPMIPARHGFALDCLHCGHADSVTVNLSDVLNFTCDECDANYSVDDVRRILGRWNAALGWLLTAPAFVEDRP